MKALPLLNFIGNWAFLLSRLLLLFLFLLWKHWKTQFLPKTFGFAQLFPVLGWMQLLFGASVPGVQRLCHKELPLKYQNSCVSWCSTHPLRVTRKYWLKHVRYLTWHCRDDKIKGWEMNLQPLKGSKGLFMTGKHWGEGFGAKSLRFSSTLSGRKDWTRLHQC